MPQLKAGSDSAQNSSSSFPSQAKGKKRELGAQGSEPVKRERMSRADDADYGQFRPEQMLKSEIGKITDRGGLVDLEGVEKLVKLMQPDSVNKKLDLACQVMLANVIAVTDRFDCLTRFVHLRGLPVLDDWLQQVHKGKIGDGSSPKESDKSVEDFLLALLRALDKLPVNLHALQTCNIGKSVNHLRTHKNSEIQKKARGLVDTWKKRVEAEMNMIDAKSGSSRGGSWPSKSVMSEVSNVVGRRDGGPSETFVRSTNTPSCTSKTPPAKLGSGDKPTTASPASSVPAKLPTLVTTSGVSSTKDLNHAANVGARSSDLPLPTIKEKSSSSSQSQNNSQSCSSDYGKMISSREDGRSSSAASKSGNKVSGGVSRNRKLGNGLQSTAVLGVKKESCIGKPSFVNRSLPSEKVSPARVTSDSHVDNGNNHRLIVRLPNTCRSPARSVNGGTTEDVSAALGKGSPLAHSEKLEHQDQKAKRGSEALRSNSVVSANIGLSQVKAPARCDEDNMTSVGTHCAEHNKNGEGPDRLTGASKTTCSPSGSTSHPGKSFEASHSSMNALIDSCAKFSEANDTATASGGDDIGMNLLASVAAGEISRCDVSPSRSPCRKSPVPEDSCSDNDVFRHKLEGRAQFGDQGHEGLNGDAATDQGSSLYSLVVKTAVQLSDVHISTNFSGMDKAASVGCEEKWGLKLDSCSIDLLRTDSGPLLTSDDKLLESTLEGSLVKSSLHVKKEVNAVVEGTDQSQDLTGATNVNSPNSKLKPGSPQSDEDKNGCCADEKSIENGLVILPAAAATNVKVETAANEESTSCLSSDKRDDVRNTASIPSGSCNLMDKNLPQVMCRKSEDTELPSGSSAVSGKESVVGKAADMKSAPHSEHGGEQRLTDQSSSRSETAHVTPEKKEATGFLPGEASPSKTPGLPEQLMSSRSKKNGAEVSEAIPDVSPVSAVGTDTMNKLDFDLNEGLPVDDGCLGEVAESPLYRSTASVYSSCPLPLTVSSLPGSLPSSVTFAAAAKGPFVPPENPLRMKGEVGWKGSAATSAFRPAEPRKVLAVPLCVTGSPLVEKPSSKPGRPLLDFDLNVPDEMALEDAASPNCVPDGYEQRSGGGLDVDLNRCDESPEIGQFSVSNSCRLEILKLPGRSSISGGLPIGQSNASRDFDLNNGPSLDESGSEAAPLVKNSLPFLSSVPNVKMNNMELGNFSSWFPPGTSYSAIKMPPMLPGGRGEQNYSVLPAVSQRNTHSGSPSFGPEYYRGPVLSSSPAVAFPPTTPFQYQGFPFETNFPLSSNSYSAVSTAYTDTSSGGTLCFPAIPSQLMGPGVVSTHYPRPYVMSNIPGATNAAVPESRKWGNQGV